MTHDHHIFVSVDVCGVKKAADSTVECTKLKSVLVDSGATHSMIPRAILAKIGVEPTSKMRATLADGRQVDFDQARARICLMDDSGKKAVCAVVPVGVIDDGHVVTVGASALRALKARVEFGKDAGVTATGQILTDGED